MREAYDFEINCIFVSLCVHTLMSNTFKNLIQKVEVVLDLKVHKILITMSYLNRNNSPEDITYYIEVNTF